VNYLIDTQCFLWSFASPELLSDLPQDIFTNPQHSLYFSAASSWEIAIKTGIGKLRLPDPPEVYVPDRLAMSGIKGLAVEHSHVLTVYKLPPLHKDPFDRVLIAQAIAESLILLTADPVIINYNVKTIWGARQNPPDTI